MTSSPARWWWRLAVTVAALGLLVGWNVPEEKTGVREPCPLGETIDILPSPHIAWDKADGVAYNSVPPTSGPHFSFSPATGVYAGPIPDGLTVHALEHGHVAIHYAPSAPKATVAAVEAVAKRHSHRVVLAPHTAVERGIALTAWGCLLRLSGPNAEVERFVVTMAGRYQHGWKP